jgi:hypothetical protein
MSNEELEQETSSLGSATMPDGQRHKTVTTEFVMTEFEPALSFSLSEEWEMAAAQEKSDSIYIYGPDQAELIFTSPSHIFDPSSPSEPTKIPAPENVDEWTSWFQRHPNLDTSEPVSVSVGGASGMQIDVLASSTPENYPRDICGRQPCVPLLPPGIASAKDYKVRFIIVEVEGKPVVIAVAAQADKFEDTLPRAQKILDTVEWKGA